MSPRFGRALLALQLGLLLLFIFTRWTQWAFRRTVTKTDGRHLARGPIRSLRTETAQFVGACLRLVPIPREAGETDGGARDDDAVREQLHRRGVFALDALSVLRLVLPLASLSRLANRPVCCRCGGEREVARRN